MCQPSLPPGPLHRHDSLRQLVALSDPFELDAVPWEVDPSAPTVPPLEPDTIPVPASRRPEAAVEPSSLPKVEGVRLSSLRPSQDVCACWHGIDDSGADVTVQMLPGSANAAVRESFLRVAELQWQLCGQPGFEGLRRVRRVSKDDDYYVADACDMGDATDLPVLDWPLAKRLSFFQKVCRTFDALHRRGIFHGAWWPGNILLSDDLEPRLDRIQPLALIGEAPLAQGVSRAQYIPAESLVGMRANAEADVYILGRLLHFLLLGKHPQAPNAGVLALDELSAKRNAPLGLVRIVRRCTVGERSERYPSVAQLLADLRNCDRPDEVGMSLPADTQRRPAILPHAPSSGRRSPDSAPRRRLPSQSDGDEPAWWRQPRLRLGALLLALLALAVLAFPAEAVSIRWQQMQLGASRAETRQAAVRSLAEKGYGELAGLDLRGCDLRGAYLASATLSGTDLSTANLEGADLSGADLTAAELVGTDLRAATLLDAVVPEAGFGAARCDDRTRMPTGWRCVAGAPAMIDGDADADADGDADADAD